MTAAALLQELIALGVILEADAGHIRFSAPPGVMTPDRLNRVRQTNPSDAGPGAADAGPGAAGAVRTPDGTGTQATADSRRAIREARRQRRRTAWLCAAFVALCLALTIVVVSLARDRPVAPPASVASVAVVPVGPVLTAAIPSAAVPSAAVPSTVVPSRGAPPPEGGNP